MSDEKKLLSKINKYFNKYFKEKGWECTAAYDVDFCYDYANDIIYYSFLVSKAHDDLFADVCKSIRPEIENVDNFVLSFFHEIGHYMTYDIFEEKDWDKQDRFQKKLNNKLKKKNLSEKEELKLYKEYYNLPIEKTATEWGVNYIVDNKEEVEKLFKGFQELAKKFLEELDKKLDSEKLDNLDDLDEEELHEDTNQTKAE